MLLTPNHFRSKIGFSHKTLSTSNEFHPKFWFSSNKLLIPRTILKISRVDRPPPSMDVVDRVVILTVDTTCERPSKRIMKTLCFDYFIYHCFEIYCICWCFSRLVKDTLEMFVKIPIKPTRQQTIACVENLVAESFFCLLSYSQLVCETIKSWTVSAVNTICRN